MKIGNFGKEAASLDTEGICESVRFAADSLRKLPAIRRRANVSYSLVVKAGYEEIRGLREDGYSYDLICEVFAQNGLLHGHTNPKALCTAFLREKKRREKKAQSSGVMKKDVISTTPKAEPAKPDFSDPLAGKEKIKALTGSAEETALGKLTKHSDGSFDFDWKN